MPSTEVDLLIYDLTQKKKGRTVDSRVRHLICWPTPQKIFVRSRRILGPGLVYTAPMPTHFQVNQPRSNFERP